MADYLVNEIIPYFGEDGLACSESRLRLLIERGVVNLPLEAVKLMSGLHGYMNGAGDRGAFCGAINGGIAALGAAFGRYEAGVSNRDLYGLVEEFITRFEKEFGSTKCIGLVGATQQEREDGQADCARYVIWAADKAARLIQEETRRRAKEKQK